MPLALLLNQLCEGVWTEKQARDVMDFKSFILNSWKEKVSEAGGSELIEGRNEYRPYNIMIAIGLRFVSLESIVAVADIANKATEMESLVNAVDDAIEDVLRRLMKRSDLRELSDNFSLRA